MCSLVRKARNNTGLSITKAAEILKISAGYLSQIEHGARHVSAERAEKISRLYRKERDEIFRATRFVSRKEGESDEKNS